MATAKTATTTASRAAAKPSTRLDVPKTYKLFIGGAFPRSESGRVTEVTDARGRFVANVAKASRKDAREAVRAARKAQPGWAGATAYNRGQVLYRVAEVLEGRKAQFVDELQKTEGLTAARAAKQVEAAIDLWVWHAGWTDKIAQIGGNANPVAGPYFNLSVPEPTGVVAIVAPQAQSLLGLTSVVAPALVTGNTVVVVPGGAGLSAISLGEVLATSDLPGGVVNILPGDAAELAPWLAGHADVNALDLTGAGELDWVELEQLAADTLKRVIRPVAGPAPETPQRILALTETKTVWHTKSRL
ncbi:aldehyde dehydrogenase family protein [Agrococcus baldri]|uniref:Aldehyde dehydrogenase n=1 Tax=Agrococcus baldri TaxID=153730 RepID=A0AA87USJ1_9MICO|nr:aldehyde dehydrogenase family protein [Agrococcus baldri]GEK80908.1 aldehyde dehydrogenase [Agrococcus baldri]